MLLFVFLFVNIVFVYSVDVVVDCDFLIELLGVNFIIVIYFLCFVEEWVLWVLEEFGFLMFSDVVLIGSSIML